MDISLQAEIIENVSVISGLPQDVVKILFEAGWEFADSMHEPLMWRKKI